MSTNNQASATEGANAGAEAREGVSDVNNKLEGIRKGINNFFDETLQPSAKHDTDAGVTSSHRPATTSTTGTTTGTSETTGERDLAGTGQGASGFSTDVENAAEGLKNMVNKH